MTTSYSRSTVCVSNVTREDLLEEKAALLADLGAQVTHTYLNLVRIKSKREGQAGATGRVMQASCYTDRGGVDWYYIKWDGLEGRYSYHQLPELEALVDPEVEAYRAHEAAEGLE